MGSGIGGGHGKIEVSRGTGGSRGERGIGRQRNNRSVGGSMRRGSSRR